MPRTKLSTRSVAGRILSGTIKKYLSIKGKIAYQVLRGLWLWTDEALQLIKQRGRYDSG